MAQAYLDDGLPFYGSATTQARHDSPARGRDTGDRLLGRIDRRRLNDVFTMLCFGTAPVFGSAVTVLYNGGAVLSVVQSLPAGQVLAKDRRIRTIGFALWIFCAAHIASALANGNLLQSGSKLPALISFACFPFLYEYWCLADRKALAAISQRSCVAACYLAFGLATFQFLVLGMRAEGAAGNAIVFAVVVAFSASVALIGALRSSGIWSAVCLGAFLLGILALLCSGSRSIWPVPVVNGLLVAWLLRDRLPDFFANRRVWFVAVAFGLLACLYVPYLVQRLTFLAYALEKLSAGNYQTTTGNRMALWSIGIEAFLRRPVAGYGAGAVRALATGSMAEIYQIKGSFTHFHNVFINTAIRSGIVGLLALVSVLVICWQTGMRALNAARDDASVFGGLLLVSFVTTFCLSGAANLTLGQDIMDTWFLVTIAVALILAIDPSAEDETYGHWPVWARVILRRIAAQPVLPLVLRAAAEGDGKGLLRAPQK